MNEHSHSLEFLADILRACVQAGGEPLYPAAYAATRSLNRDQLDQALDQLRLARLLRLTDWAPEKGQGYVLTQEGHELIQAGNYQQRLGAWLSKPVQQIKRAQLELTHWERGEAVRDVLLRPAPPVAAMTLLFLNVAVFLGGLGLALSQGVKLETYLSGSLLDRVMGRKAQEGHEAVAQQMAMNRVFHWLGALDPGAVLDRDQWWRIITSGFVHSGFLHLLCNMFALYMLGPLLEKMWGSWRFVVIYFISLVTSGCAVLLASRSAVGASGAICGMMLSLMAWVLLNRQSLPLEWVNRLMSGMMINLVLMIYISFVPGISWQGHLGGAIGGLLASVPMNFQRFGRSWQRLAGALGVVLVPLAGLGLVLALRGSNGQPPPPPDPVQAALASLQKAFAQAEHRSFATYEKDLLPLLDKSLRFKDTKELAKRFPNARTAFEHAQKDLKPTLELFKEAEPLATEEQTEAAKRTRQYLETWSELFSWAQTYCEQPLIENRLALLNQRKQVLDLIPAQRENRFFRSALSLSKDPEKKKSKEK